MKDKSIIIDILNMFFWGVILYLLTRINNIFATVVITFFLTNIFVIINEILEIKLLYKESKFLIALSEIKKMNDKIEKAVNIITFFYPSIFATLVAFIIHLIYILL